MSTESSKPMTDRKRTIEDDLASIREALSTGQQSRRKTAAREALVRLQAYLESIDPGLAHPYEDNNGC